MQRDAANGKFHISDTGQEDGSDDDFDLAPDPLLDDALPNTPFNEEDLIVVKKKYTVGFRDSKFDYGYRHKT